MYTVLTSGILLNALKCIKGIIISKYLYIIYSYSETVKQQGPISHADKKNILY